MKKIDFLGVIVPREWDQKGTITELSLCMEDEQEFTIKLDQKGKELLQYLSCKIKIKGGIDEEKNIVVSDYFIITWGL